MKTALFPFKDGEKEVSKGDIVCIVGGSNKGNSCNEAEIISIGSKYITIEVIGPSWEYQFNLSDGRVAGNVRGEAPVLYSSLEARQKVAEKQRSLADLNEYFRSGRCNKLTTDQIDAIKEIIGLNQEKVS